MHPKSVCQPILGQNFWICTFLLDGMQFIKVAIKGENMEEYKHVADSNFKVSGITSQTKTFWTVFIPLTVTERDDYTPTERGGNVLPRHFIIGVFDAYRLKLT